LRRDSLPWVVWTVDKTLEWIGIVVGRLNVVGKRFGWIGIIFRKLDTLGSVWILRDTLFCVYTTPSRG